MGTKCFQQGVAVTWVIGEESCVEFLGVIISQ